MTKIQTDFDAAQIDAPKKYLLVRPMTPHDIRGEMTGMQIPASGDELKEFTDKCVGLLGNSLVIVEPHSKSFPEGEVIGYALIMKSDKLFPSGIAISDLYVIPEHPDKAAAYKALIEKSARLSLAHGKTAMDILTEEGDDPIVASIMQEYGADFMCKGIKIGTHDVHTISDLSGKFGYGAEKKARAARTALKL